MRSFPSLYLAVPMYLERMKASVIQSPPQSGQQRQETYKKKHFFFNHNFQCTFQVLFPQFVAENDAPLGHMPLDWADFWEEAYYTYKYC